MIDYKFYYCICNYHFVFVIIKLFWQKKFWFSVNNKFANDFFFQFLISDFFMVVKAEVKNTVIFKSKYECRSSLVEVKYVLSTVFDFSGFRQISGFSEKKTFEIFIVEICEVEIGMAGRSRCCRFYDHRILSLLSKMYFSAILRVKGNKTFFLSQLCWSVVTNLRTYY